MIRGALRNMLDKFRYLYYRAYILSNRIHKRDLIVFGARGGNYYMDNSRTLYEWYLVNRPNQEVLWLTKSPEVYSHLAGKNLPVARLDSHKGLKAIYQAKIGFYTNKSQDLVTFPELLPHDFNLVFLGHGQSVKNSRLTVKSGITSSFKKDILQTGHHVFKAVTSSPWMASIQSESHGLTIEKYIITGFPRNDWMIQLPEAAKISWENFIGDQNFNKVVLYAPTWRMHGEATVLFPFEDWDVHQLAEFLSKHQILLLIRPHIKELHLQHNWDKVEALINATPFVKLATSDTFADANFLLPFVDMLISDYSSIYHDFLFLNRPLAFIPYDYGQFEAQNGFKYPYYENLPGPELTNLHDLIDTLKNLVEDNDVFSKHRLKLIEKIYTHIDGNSCERIALALEKEKFS